MLLFIFSFENISSLLLLYEVVIYIERFKNCLFKAITMNDFLTSKESTLKKVEKIEIHFDGIFQNRLATDPDPFDNPRGDLGWTRSHTGEPDFDRIIRFNNPISPRSFIEKVGVFITKVTINRQNFLDSLVGQMINLGSNTQFVGTPNVGGKEVLINFQVSIGTNQIHLSGKTLKTPFNLKYEREDSELAKIKTGIKSEQDMLNFVNERIQLLNSNSENDIIDRERLDNLANSLWLNTPWNTRPLLMLMNFRFPIDKDIKLDKLDSEIIKIIKDSTKQQNLIFNSDFYSYDGDGLIGRVTGLIEVELVDH
jgi:hypothetical protein